MATEFRSPRFVGDLVLEEILRDPDTGTKKLGPGSPESDSIKKVQQALFDLMWTQRIDTPVSDPFQFVIGIFGPITSKTVLAYKRHYDIHFPPSAPTASSTISSVRGHWTCSMSKASCSMSATPLWPPRQPRSRQQPAPVTTGLRSRSWTRSVPCGYIPRAAYPAF